MSVRGIVDLFKDTYREWSEDKAPTLGAALAYFTVFSLAPLLVVVIAVAGFVFGEEAARGQLFEQIRGVAGDDAAMTIQGMVASASQPRAGIIGTVVGTVTLLLGAAGVFGQLNQALNTIWETAPKRGGGIMGFVKDKLLSFTMVLGIGFLLLVSLVLSAALSAFGGLLADVLPGLGPILRLVNFALSFAVITLLFAMIFKILPDVDIPWSDVWLGAAVTALLFTIGKELIGLYLGLSDVGSAFGAAGSLVVVLVWIYYSAQILFFGAEFTQVYSNKHGSRFRRAAPAGAGDLARRGTEMIASAAGPRSPHPAARSEDVTAPPRRPAGPPAFAYVAALLGLLAGALAGAVRLRAS